MVVSIAPSSNTATRKWKSTRRTYLTTKGLARRQSSRETTSLSTRCNALSKSSAWWTGRPMKSSCLMMKKLRFLLRTKRTTSLHSLLGHEMALSICTLPSWTCWLIHHQMTTLCQNFTGAKLISSTLGIRTKCARMTLSRTSPGVLWQQMASSTKQESITIESSCASTKLKVTLKSTSPRKELLCLKLRTFHFPSSTAERKLA